MTVSFLFIYLGYTILTSSTFILQKLTNAVLTSLDANHYTLPFTQCID